MKIVKINESQFEKIFETSSFVQTAGESNLSLPGAEQAATSPNAAIIHDIDGNEINQGQTDDKLAQPVTGKKISNTMSNSQRFGYVGSNGRGL
jgi:hypothetical protein